MKLNEKYSFFKKKYKNKTLVVYGFNVILDVYKYAAIKTDFKTLRPASSRNINTEFLP